MEGCKQKIAETANLLCVLVSRDTRGHFYMETRRVFALRQFLGKVYKAFALKGKP